MILFSQIYPLLAYGTEVSLCYSDKDGSLIYDTFVVGPVSDIPCGDLAVVDLYVHLGVLYVVF